LRTVTEPDYIPVILVSSHPISYINKESKKLFDAKIQKPVKRNILKDKIINVLSTEVTETGNENISLEDKLKSIKTIKNPRILIVEDNLINQKLTALLVEKMNCLYDLAENGKIAIELMKTNIYDLILMDCQMPEMDGYTATQHIRKYKYGENSMKIPVIALTANAMKGDREECLEAGMDDYLSKPIDPLELKEKLEKWIPGQ